MRKILFTLALISAAPHLAAADGTLPKLLTPFDKDRLTKLDATASTAIAEARAGGSKADIAVLDAALAGKPLEIANFNSTGAWKCRTIKAGGTLPLVVYPWFTCRISEDGAGMVLQKVSGSQRTKGTFYTLSDTQLAYLGAGSYNDDPPRRYGEDPKADQVAIAERRGSNRLILLFPAPHHESKLDILVLER